MALKDSKQAEDSVKTEYTMVVRPNKLKNLQERHLQGILQYVTLMQGVTKIQLSNLLGMSLSSMNELVNRLLEQGWLRQAGTFPGDRGRKAQLFQMNPDHACLLGIDCGRKTTKAVVADLWLRPIAIETTQTPFKESQQTILRNIVQTAQAALRSSGKPLKKIVGGGLGLAGQVDERAGRCLNFFSKPEWNDFPIQSYLSEHLNLPFLIVGWSRGGLLAEKWFGKARNVQSLLFVHIGSTISMGMAFNGSLYLSASGVSGELGHMTAKPNGPRCYCGNQGCLEAVASENGILEQVASALSEGIQSRVNDYGRKDNYTYEDVVQAANDGDKLAFQVLEQTGEYLGTCVADAINLLSPELVILGGHVFDKARQIIRTVEVTIRKRALETATRNARIEFTSFGAETLVLGAAAAVFECIVTPNNVFGLTDISERFPLQKENGRLEG